MKTSTNKRYLVPLSVFGLISWTGFIFVLFYLEPCSSYSNVTGLFCDSGSTLGLLLFYSTLFFSLTCTYAMIGYLSRIWAYKAEIYTSHFNISLRQGILLAVCTLGILAFASFDILRWWTTLVLLITIILIEFNFLSREY